MGNSTVAAVLTFLLWLLDLRFIFKSESSVRKFCNNRMLVSKAPATVPGNLKKRYIVREREMASDQWKIVTFESKPAVAAAQSNGKTISILFFHGGAFVVGASMMHWNLIDDLMKAAIDDRGFGRVVLIMPLYGRSPEYTHADFYPLMLDHYSEVSKTADFAASSRVIFMGDSAGGNLALSFALQLKPGHHRDPDSIVLLSPWLDLCLSNKGIRDKAREDYVLARNGLLAAGKWWSRVTCNCFDDMPSESESEKKLDPENCPIKHPFLSPMRMRKEPRMAVHVFIGSRDIFEPDCVDFAAKFPNQVRLHRYEGMFHVWMMYPVPMVEKTQALNEIYDIFGKGEK